MIQQEVVPNVFNIAWLHRETQIITIIHPHHYLCLSDNATLKLCLPVNIYGHFPHCEYMRICITEHETYI